MSTTTRSTNPGKAEVLKASPPMFDSRFLDYFTRVHPIIPVVIFGPAIALLFHAGQRDMGVGRALVWVAGGYLVWTLSEYWLHRVVFHFEPDHPLGRRVHWMIHGVHHDHPNDPLRLVMPPSASIPLGAIFYGLFILVLGTPAAYPVAAGFFAGYLAYDMTHYHLHHHKSRTPLGKYLRELHMRHHFQDHQRGFGVSAPWWDRAFGTAPRRNK